MLSDVLLIEEKHHSAAEILFQQIESIRNGRFVIAISGESGSGKTELSHCLANRYKKAGMKAKPMHTDNYYKSLPEERNSWRAAHGRESIGYTEYDWEKINNNIADFRKGKISELPCVDIVTDQVDQLITDFGPVDILILDGLYAIKSEDVDLRVFIDITYQETKKAQQRRGKEPATPFRTMVLEREHEVVTSLKPMANLMVTRDYSVIPSKETKR
ncbi:MAG: hypothetical protein M0O94_01795 [Bacteroidales bacterium]|nr:hypothetical protein [Bacteroidales bacterium]MDD2323385.1 hypothetical protein [Bacteroidales bacterium]MDD3961747.1 hypothetical protein [Bacteroidales bacterium]MDY0285117.1 hypothetical protein [Bacteroidales bacterium]HPE86572.1 hypothetical protein [Bacteroidales bacterium]